MPMIDIQEVLKMPEHTQRIANVVTIREYLLRVHKVLNRKDFKFKEETYSTAKIVLNTLKSIINFHTSYVVGNPVCITGESKVVKDFNLTYKKGLYTKVDYDIASDLYKFGNAFEYIYKKDGIIKSKVIDNSDSYPIYDDNFNYVAFLEHWDDVESGSSNDILYYPKRVEVYKDNAMVDSYTNISGLPIHYATLDKSAYNHFGDSLMNDLMPIVDQIEALVSKLDDAINTLSMNPLGVSSGQRINDSIPKDMVGATLNLEDGGEFKFVNAKLDYESIKLLLDNLIQSLYTVAGVPSSVIGQGNIANVSEVSLKLLFSQTDSKAKQTIQALREGFIKRFEAFRCICDNKYSDEEFDTLDVEFNVNRPVDTSSLINELKVQRELGAISIETIIDKSPYTTDTTLEMERLARETITAVAE